MSYITRICIDNACSNAVTESIDTAFGMLFEAETSTTPDEAPVQRGINPAKSEPDTSRLVSKQNTARHIDANLLVPEDFRVEPDTSMWDQAIIEDFDPNIPMVNLSSELIKELAAASDVSRVKELAKTFKTAVNSNEQLKQYLGAWSKGKVMKGLKSAIKTKCSPAIRNYLMVSGAAMETLIDGETGAEVECTPINRNGSEIGGSLQLGYNYLTQFYSVLNPASGAGTYVKVIERNNIQLTSDEDETEPANTAEQDNGTTAEKQNSETQSPATNNSETPEQTETANAEQPQQPAPAASKDSPEEDPTVKTEAVNNVQQKQQPKGIQGEYKKYILDHNGKPPFYLLVPRQSPKEKARISGKPLFSDKRIVQTTFGGHKALYFLDNAKCNQLFTVG